MNNPPSIPDDMKYRYVICTLKHKMDTTCFLSNPMKYVEAISHLQEYLDRLFDEDGCFKEIPRD